MHEFGVVTYLIQGVEAKARELGARRIVTVNLIIGDRASIVAHSLSFYFDMLSRGTLAEGAQLNIKRQPSQFYCSLCDCTFIPSGEDFRCPHCQTVGRLHETGSEFLVESIEIEGGVVS